MENCLVTKLKGATNNRKLPVFNYLRVFLPASLEFAKAYITDTTSGAIFHFDGKTIGDGSFFSLGGNTYEDIDTDNNAVTLVHAHDTYYDTNMDGSTFIFGIVNAEDLIPSNTVTKITLGTALDEGGNIVPSTGSINSIGALFPNLNMFTGTYLHEMTGDITTAFGSNKKINLIGIRNSEKITGSLEELATALLQAPNRTVNWCDIQCNDKITYNGVVVGNAVTKRILLNFANNTYDVITP